MQTNNLPTDDLKKYGIVEPDNSFSKKLSAEDIQKFLQGYTIVADNDKNRATFQLVENNSRLNVVFLERDKSISTILENSRNQIDYSEIKDISKSENQFNFEKMIKLIVDDPALMAGDDLSAGVEAGTICINDFFTSGIGVINSFITENNTEFVFIEDQAKIDRLVGVGILDNIGSEIVKNPLQLLQINPQGEIPFDTVFLNNIIAGFF